MLTVSQSERWTASKLLQHAWIRAGDSELSSRDLSGSIVQMKKFNARQRFRAAGNAVIMSNRMSMMIKSNNDSKDSERLLGHMGTSFSGVRSMLVNPDLLDSGDTSDIGPLPAIQEGFSASSDKNDGVASATVDQPMDAAGSLSS